VELSLASDSMDGHWTSKLHIDSLLVFDPKEDTHGVLIFHKAKRRAADPIA
jgi:hypothetical protein